MSSSRKVDLPKQNAKGETVLAKGAVNPRRMRRIIADDPSWNRDRVPTLVNLCINAIVCNFKDHPILHELPPEFAYQVLNELPTSLPLELAVRLIDDDGYWKRAAAIMTDKVHDVTKHGNSWKRLFFEKYVQRIIEEYIPGTSPEEPLHRVLALSKDYVVNLSLTSLQPPIKAMEEHVLAPHVLPEEVKVESIRNQNTQAGAELIKLMESTNFGVTNGDGVNQSNLWNEEYDNDDDDDDDESIIADHLDIGAVVEQLPKLEGLQISYRVKGCGMKFNWSMFGMTSGDAQMLAECVKYSGKIQSLSVTESLMNDRHVRRLASKLLDNEYLRYLDLSHNEIGDKGVRGLAKLLNGHSKIKSLCLANNQIAEIGAQALGKALRGNIYVTTLDLRLNNLGDKGVHVLFKELAHNGSLHTLNISSNGITNRSVPALGDLIENNKCLRYLDLTCNELGDPAGKAILEALDRNKTLVSMDMRMTGFSPDTEIAISEVLSRNMHA